MIICENYYEIGLSWNQPFKKVYEFNNHHPDCIPGDILTLKIFRRFS